VADLLDAFGFERVVMETVGVGQSELEIAGTADTTAWSSSSPRAGDSIQAMKAGLMEIADVFVVNKADRPGADKLANELELMLHMRLGDMPPSAGHHGVSLKTVGRHARESARQAAQETGAWAIPVLKTVSQNGEGVDELARTLDRHRVYLAASGELSRRRRRGWRSACAPWWSGGCSGWPGARGAARLWTMRQFAGFGTPRRRTSASSYLLEHGQTGLSTAFDMPTLMGYDSDHPRSLGEVGQVRRRDRLARRHGDALRRASRSRGLDVDDDQLAGAMLLAFYVVAARSRACPAREAARARSRTTSSRSTSRRRSTSSRPSRRCGSSPT
jgi:hypothetical protein